MKYLILDGNQRVGVHPINSTRSEYGEYHHLFSDLRKYPKKFKEYTRMSIATFDELLSLVSDDIYKQTTNFRQAISPEERLVVTIR